MITLHQHHLPELHPVVVFGGINPDRRLQALLRSAELLPPRPVPAHIRVARSMIRLVDERLSKVTRRLLAPVELKDRDPHRIQDIRIRRHRNKQLPPHRFHSIPLPGRPAMLDHLRNSKYVTCWAEICRVEDQLAFSSLSLSSGGVQVT